MQKMTNETERDYVARVFALSPEESASLEDHVSLAAAVAQECIALIQRTPHQDALDATTMRRWLINGQILLAGQDYTPLAAINHPHLGQLLLEDLRQANRVR